MLNFVFGKTFWSTVIRSALFFPLITAIILPLILLFGSAEDIAEISSVSRLMWAISMVWGFFFGAWIGWGLAYWRFDERPIKRGRFANYPLLTGLIIGPVYWVLVRDLAVLNPEFADAQWAATIFGLIVGPLMALFTATFWRYAPQLTTLRKPRK